MTTASNGRANVVGAGTYLDVGAERLGMTFVRRELVDSFRAAVSAYTGLQRCPAWRPRRRRELERALERNAATADRCRRALGGKPDDPGLIAILIASDVALNGIGALTRGRILR